MSGGGEADHRGKVRRNAAGKRVLDFIRKIN